MEIISLILSGIAVILCAVILVLTIREQKQNARLWHELRVSDAKEYEETLRYRAAVSAEMEKLLERIERLEQGIIPDFEEAKEAVRSVNNFNAGLSAILNFDPMEALRREREKNVHGVVAE